MQFNKLNKFMVALSVLAVMACSSKKSVDSDQSAIESVETAVERDISSGAQAQSEIQELNKSNIVYFGLDKYDIAPAFSELLDAHAKFLRENPSYKVVVEGHTDERGTPEYNIALAERRANAVKMYLQGKGVAAEQISIVSYGKEKPVVLGHDESAFARNRRAVLVY